MNNRAVPISTAAAGGLRAASAVEAATLAALVFVAVPMKHLAHVDIATLIMGPIHGAAFFFYVWALVQAAAEGGWRRGEIARMILVACIPLGGFFNQRWLGRKIRRLRERGETL
jgi:integral membrane protein